jgi:hypothetical protein
MSSGSFGAKAHDNFKKLARPVCSLVFGAEFTFTQEPEHHVFCSGRAIDLAAYRYWRLSI